MSTLLVWLAVPVALYGFFLLFAWLSADALIFQPGVSSYRDDASVIKIPAADGTPLSALHLVAPRAEFTFLYLHGNAEDLGDIRARLAQFPGRGHSVLAFDYRGYGTTPGKPSEANVHADAAAALKYLREQAGVPLDRIVLYGRSLGSGPAVELAAREPVAGIVLEGAFTSAFCVVTRYPLIPGDRFSNVRKLSRVRCPLLVIHGRRDRTIPFVHGELLFSAAREPKQHLWLDDAGHNDLVEVAADRYWNALAQFTRSLRP